eukprot:6092808-Pyramimonas_sp.AAC.1
MASSTDAAQMSATEPVAAADGAVPDADDREKKISVTPALPQTPDDKGTQGSVMSELMDASSSKYAVSSAGKGSASFDD